MSLNQNYVRAREGNQRPRQFAYNATLGAPGALGQGGPAYPISIGDMVWVDPSSAGLLSCRNLIGLEAIKGADAFPWTTDLATTQANFAAVFAGIAAQCWTALSDPCTSIIGNYGIKDGLIRVDTGGVFEMACATGTILFNGDMVGPAQNGSNTALLPQTVVKVAAKNRAIGTVAFAERTNYGQQGSISVELFDFAGQGVGSALLPTTTTTSTTTSTTTTTTTTTASSDIRIKQNVRRLAAFLGLGVYRFNFIGSAVPVVGLMAQEVYAKYPSAVVVGGEDPAADPWRIDYRRLFALIGADKAAALVGLFGRLNLAQS